MFGREPVLGAHECHTESLNPLEVDVEGVEAVAEHESAGMRIHDGRSTSGGPRRTEDRDDDVVAAVAGYDELTVIDSAPGEDLPDRRRGV